MLVTPQGYGRRSGVPVPWDRPVSRSSGRSARRGRLATTRPRRPAPRTGPSGQVPVRRRPRAGRHRAHPRAAGRPGATGPGQLAAGDDDTPEAEQGTQTRLATASTASARRVPASSRASATKAAAAEQRAPRAPAGSRQPRVASRAPGPARRCTTTCTARARESTASTLAASRPPRPRGVIPSRRSTPYRRSKPGGDGLGGERGGDDGRGRGRRARRGRSRRPGPRSGRRSSSARPGPARAARARRAAARRCAAGCRVSNGPGRAPLAGGAAAGAAGAAALIGRPRGQREVDVLEGRGRRSPRRACPSATTRPAAMMTTWSASRSASSKEWVVTTTRRPGPPRPHQVPHVEPGVRVEAGGRLVEEEHLGAAEQGGGERHPLPLATGEPAHGRAGERRRCPAGRPARRAARGCGVQGGEVAQQPQRPAGRWAARRPGASRPTRARWSAPARHGSAPSTCTDPASGRCSPSSALDRGGLAGAVRAEQRGDRAGRGRPRWRRRRRWSSRTTCAARAPPLHRSRLDILGWRVMPRIDREAAPATMVAAAPAALALLLGRPRTAAAAGPAPGRRGGLLPRPRPHPRPRRRAGRRRAVARPTAR